MKKPVLTIFLIILAQSVMTQRSDELMTSPSLAVAPFVEVKSYVLNQDQETYLRLGKWMMKRYYLLREVGIPFDSVIWYIERGSFLLEKAYKVEYGSIEHEDTIAAGAECLGMLTRTQIDTLLTFFEPWEPPKPDGENFFIEKEPETCCSPVYRNALVFFDKAGSIVGKIDVCFTCMVVRINGQEERDWPQERWDAFKLFFRDELGHKVDWMAL